MVMTYTLTNVEALLSRTICPMCYHGELEAMLRCDLTPRACLATIRCTYCGFAFEPETERRSLEAIAKRLAAGELRAACPTCGSHESHVEFRCTLSDHRCCYFLTCRDCGGAHQLYV